MSEPRRKKDILYGARQSWRLTKHCLREKSPFRKWCRRWFFEKPELVPLHLTWIFTFGLALFAYFAWLDARDNSEKLQQQIEVLRNQQRPWISISGATLNTAAKFAWRMSEYLTPSDEKNDAFKGINVGVEITYTINNAGRSPGHFVTLLSELNYIDQPILFEIIHFHPDQCGEQKQTDALFTAGATIFPSQTTHISAYAAARGDDLSRWKDNSGNFYKYSRHRKLFLSGCIDYLIGDASGRHHQTPFVYELQHEDGQSVHGDAAGNLDLTDIKLVPMIGPGVGDAD